MIFREKTGRRFFTIRSGAFFMLFGPLMIFYNLFDNHNSQRWISESNIRYSRTFTLEANIMKYKNHKLVFEGIDTYGTIILNE